MHVRIFAHITFGRRRLRRLRRSDCWRSSKCLTHRFPNKAIPIYSRTRTRPSSTAPTAVRWKSTSVTEQLLAERLWAIIYDLYLCRSIDSDGLRWLVRCVYGRRSSECSVSKQHCSSSQKIQTSRDSRIWTVSNLSKSIQTLDSKLVIQMKSWAPLSDKQFVSRSLFGLLKGTP